MGRPLVKQNIVSAFKRSYEAAYGVQTERQTWNDMQDIEIEPALKNFFGNSSIALALASAERDNPLVLASKQFYALTGYDSTDVMGRNCRFLQQRPDGEYASNDDAKRKLHAFIHCEDANVRTPIVNFRKDGRPFVNLLFMSKLKAANGKVRYIIASQFDVSRTHPDLLQAYDDALGDTLAKLKPLLDGHNVMVEGTLATIANSTSTIAQAKLALAEMENNSLY
jgi:PAS domain S-box-containing protein